MLTQIDDMPVSERVERYVLDGSDSDLRRLLFLARLLAPPARTSLTRAGIEPGWRVIECGCGPLGALAVLSEMVGPSGRVVGVDFSESAVRRARSVVDKLRLDNVEVVLGDALDLDAAVLGGPFDVAYSRCFLLHQRDPVRALSAMADLLRGGGWIVAQEPLGDPQPLSHPPYSAVPASWNLFQSVVRRLGQPDRAVADLPKWARAAGLEVVQLSGFFQILDADAGFDLHATAIAAMKDRAVQLGVADAADVDEVVGALRSAQTTGCEWVTTPFFFDATLRKPSH